MPQCASWNPYIRPGIPYEPEPYLSPTPEELEAMTPHRFNKERTKAKAWWFYFMRRKWRAYIRATSRSSTRDQKIDELQAIYREGRAYIFGPEPRGCNTDLIKKPWKSTILYGKAWETNKPSWYDLVV